MPSGSPLSGRDRKAFPCRPGLDLRQAYCRPSSDFRVRQGRLRLSTFGMFNEEVGGHASIGPSAFFHAAIPPCKCNAALSPASCAACTAIAERSP